MSDLAKLGSLSHRFNVGPVVNSGPVKNSPDDDQIVLDEIEDDENTLKKELKKSKDSMKALEAEYAKCEQQCILGVS